MFTIEDSEEVDENDENDENQEAEISEEAASEEDAGSESDRDAETNDVRHNFYSNCNNMVIYYIFNLQKILFKE